MATGFSSSAPYANGLAPGQFGPPAPANLRQPTQYSYTSPALPSSTYAGPAPVYHQFFNGQLYSDPNAYARANTPQINQNYANSVNLLNLGQNSSNTNYAAGLHSLDDASATLGRNQATEDNGYTNDLRNLGLQKTSSLQSIDGYGSYIGGGATQSGIGDLVNKTNADYGNNVDQRNFAHGQTNATIQQAQGDLPFQRNSLDAGKTASDASYNNNLTLAGQSKQGQLDALSTGAQSFKDSLSAYYSRAANAQKANPTVTYDPTDVEKLINTSHAGNVNAGLTQDQSAQNIYGHLTDPNGSYRFSPQAAGQALQQYLYSK